jgi:hypothetical protein
MPAWAFLLGGVDITLFAWQRHSGPDQHGWSSIMQACSDRPMAAGRCLSKCAHNGCRYNGRYIQTKGLMEEVLMDKLLDYLEDHRKNSSKPFFTFYAPHAVHSGFLRPGQGPRWQRPAPPQYLARYSAKYPELSRDTAQVGCCEQ